MAFRLSLAWNQVDNVKYEYMNGGGGFELESALEKGDTYVVHTC